jgi:hypothetical protein
VLDRCGQNCGQVFHDVRYPCPQGY